MATDAPTPSPVRWLSPDEQAGWRNFISGSRRLLDRLERDLKDHGLSHDDYGVLVALSEADGGRLRMADLADLSVESRSRLSHHIGRMEAKGLVKRESCPDDRRGLFAVLTDEGRALMAETAPHHVAGVRAHFLDQLQGDELAVISEAFRRIDEAFGPDGRCPGS
ncbi:MAG: MarR family transcriptional regulator [Acidimicrobiales bacterium]|nr:MarR family transcriptional regulator [Acidimicrobiales bacterium]